MTVVWPAMGSACSASVNVTLNVGASGTAPGSTGPSSDRVIAVELYSSPSTHWVGVRIGGFSCSIFSDTREAGRAWLEADGVEIPF